MMTQMASRTGLPQTLSFCKLSYNQKNDHRSMLFIAGGGNGVIREFEFQKPASLTLLTERRRLEPWGLQGGDAASPGRNCLNGQVLPGKVAVDVQVGDRLLIETPGGGAWGKAK